ncbi:glyoxalase/bleomycin resistance/dioxygenase family protein [Tsukamurella tyrosinosolvens]|uniref:VOC family protein n=1 Tax=Tsukamurella tyrosinosolvens TaxID=57704 RepID=UPI0007969B7E|nr:glyoxalase/bleomycin resistance/dioxygenase family protein [Tsukamurella tyrosinosolvens]KXP02259.1 hypothetical protein AXK59_17025 [Tsukamurella tyrosinosolvens]KZL96397.1 hypothetical protein AXX05_12660 [Tsukamurella tyrosinosolvens]MCA4996256.1 glyoxalase/bleomycin resistance/dioxygenase family protein [Tsukamurella tyrosinosolvens]
MTPTDGSGLTSVIAVLPVTDFDGALTWYATWIGRRPDVEPAEGVAEWRVAENAWIQVTAEPEASGRTNVVIGVADLEAQRARCLAAGTPWGEVNDYGVVRTADAVDPAGNTITFAEEVVPGDAES